MYSGSRVAEMLPEVRHVGSDTRFRHVVGDKTHVAWAGLAQGDRRVGHGGMRRENGFDLSRLDAMAPQLDLVIHTAEILDPTGGQTAGEVTGSVHAIAILERIGDKNLIGHFWAVQVATGQPSPRNVDLTGDTGRNGIETVVEQIDTGIGGRLPDRHRTRHVDRGVVTMDHAPDGCLRRAIFVVDGEFPPRGSMDGTGEVGAKVFAAEDQ